MGFLTVITFWFETSPSLGSMSLALATNCSEYFIANAMAPVQKDIILLKWQILQTDLEMSLRV